MTLNEKLTICEMVISALRKQQKVTEITMQLSMEDQLEVIRFMEFLEEGSGGGAPH